MLTLDAGEPHPHRDCRTKTKNQWNIQMISALFLQNKTNILRNTHPVCSLHIKLESSQAKVFDSPTITCLTFTGSPCNSRIFGEMEIRELQNREFQGPPYLGLDVPLPCIISFL